MPFDGNGVYTPPAASFPAVALTLIESAKFNSTVNDIASALSSVITRDGQSPATGNLPMGGFRHTGVSNGSARDQYASVAQLQDATPIWGGTAGGTADALTLNLSPVITAYATGMVIRFKSGASPNTGAATLQVNGIVGPKALQNNGAALAAGMIAANSWYEVLYDGTAFQLQPYSSLGLATAGNNTWTGTNTFLDSLLSINDNGDPTKQFGVEVSGVTAGQRRVGTVPDYNFRFMTQTKGSDIASAATINLDTATGDLIDITGSTGPVTAITLAEGKSAWLRCVSTPTFTNGASLIISGGSFTAEAGDILLCRGYSGGVVRVYPIKANGAQLGLAATGSSYVLLGSATASSSSSIDFTSLITNTYDNYEVWFYGVLPATNATSLLIRGSTNNGSSYLSTNEYFSGRIQNAASASTPGGGADNAASSITIADALSNAGSGGSWGSIRLQRSSGSLMLVEWKAVWVNNASNVIQTSGGGIISANGVNAIRFLSSSGNIASGIFFLYGVKKA
jgi:hypothetical protein